MDKLQPDNSWKLREAAIELHKRHREALDRLIAAESEVIG